MWSANKIEFWTDLLIAADMVTLWKKNASLTKKVIVVNNSSLILKAKQQAQQKNITK